MAGPEASERVGNLTSRKQTFELLGTRILTFYSEARDILQRKMPKPRLGIVYPTYVCNQDCLWCEYASENSQNTGIMDAEKFHHLLEDLANLGVEGIEFCGGGEPTLHPNLDNEITYLKRTRGVSVGLITNGTRLRGKLAEAVVECCSYVRVGMDAGTAATFNRVKRPKALSARFDAVCDNVSKVVALRNGSESKLRVSLKVVVDQNNYTELQSCVELAAQLGVDSIQFKAARLVDTELVGDQGAAVTSELARLRALYPAMPIVGGVEKVEMTKRCWLTPLQITVDALGDVYLCCYYTHRKEQHKLGNAFTEQLSSLWYAEEHWKAIENIQPKECSRLDCRFVKYNDILDDLVVEANGQFEFI